MQGIYAMAMVWAAAVGTDTASRAAQAPQAQQATQAPATAKHTITVDEALSIIDTRQPALLAARARMEAAASAAKSQRGRLLPSVHVGASENWYHSSVYVSKTLLGSTDPNMFKAFPSNVSVGMLSVAASQPILGLLHLSEDYAAASNAADASAESLKASRAEMRARLKTYYLRMFEARSLAATASASQHDLEEQVSVAQRKVDVGSLTTADVLRLQVAAANAKQQAIAAQSQETSLRAALSELLGVGDEDGVEFVEPTSLQEVSAPPSLEKAKEDALNKRPEIAAQRLQAHAAKQRANARSWALLPEVDVTGTYMVVGVSPFDSQMHGVLDVKAASIGVAAKWALFEGGASFYDQDRAQAEASAAALEAQDAVETIRADVAGRRADLVAALSNVDVAQVQVASAEEAYRVMQALMNAGSATTTDLLDAEAALTQARMNLVHARYEAAVTSVALQRATGNDI